MGQGWWSWARQWGSLFKAQARVCWAAWVGGAWFGLANHRPNPAKRPPMEALAAGKASKSAAKKNPQIGCKSIVIRDKPNRPSDASLDCRAPLNPMALSSRPAFSAACNVLRRCGRPAQPAGQQLGQQLSPSLQRQLSSSAARSSTQDAVETAADQTERPRWSYTPERMKGPGFSINIVKNPTRTIWSNNNDPAKLDAMYNRLLGSNGDRVLPDETKWLAVTHKSFDQGRRGFNTRLAYFGAF